MKIEIEIFILTIYSAVMRWILWPLLVAAAVVSDHVKRQIDGRETRAHQHVGLARKRRLFSQCVVFFCSSAGEYEQAKPLIDRLKAQKIFTHVFFFSRSGFDFALARQEPSSVSLAPIDTLQNWGCLFAALQPNHVLIVRHEFWPAFLCAARFWCTPTVINAVPPAMFGRESKWQSRVSAWGKRMMLGPKVRVYAADDGGLRYFIDYVKVKSSQVTVSGDTKYDRVIERVQAMMAQTAEKAKVMRRSWGEASWPVLVLGSAHLPDVEFVLAALDHGLNIRLLVVPHDVSSKNVARIADVLRQGGRRIESLTDLELLTLDGKHSDRDTVIVDSVGRLSELYACGDLAWVGGAMHAKIHNVLEPAAWGLPISSGPHFQNSQEAVALHGAGLLRTSVTPQEAVQVWHKQLSEHEDQKKQLARMLRQLSGGSDRVLSETLTIPSGVAANA